MGKGIWLAEMKTILVTGAGGSGGSFFCDYLANNHPALELHGLIRWHSTSTDKNIASLKGKIHLQEVDLGDFSSVMKALISIAPDAVVHFAAHANVRSSFDNPLSVLANNVTGTSNLLEAMKMACPKSRLILISTSEVYGQVDPKNIPIKEDCPLNPASPYAVSKVTQDLLGQVYWLAYKLPVIRTRMFTYLNPRRADLFATSFALQVARIELGKQKVLQHGNLDSMRTLIDIRDAMSAYWAALNRGIPGEVYNIGGTATMTVGQFLSKLIALADCEIETQENPSLLRPADVTLQVPDTSHFFAATGWIPEYDINDSIQYLLDDCRRQVV